MIRTEELLAARKLDGAEQYFTRPMDFGFTRSVEETYQKWNREEVPGDMVRVIRMMRPLVVVSGFSDMARDGQGWKVEADPKPLAADNLRGRRPREWQSVR